MNKNAVAVMVLVAALCCCSQDNTTTAPITSAFPLPSSFESQRIAGCALHQKVQVGESPEWQTVRQIPHPATATMKRMDEGVHVLAVPEETSIIEATFDGMKVRVLNNTNEPRPIATVDYALYLVQEARGPDSTWRPIESFPNPICIFSYFSVALEPMRYWEFDVPRYTGTYKTRLRFALLTKTGELVHSQEFDGAVNPGQLRGQPLDPDKLFLPGHRFTMPL